MPIFLFIILPFLIEVYIVYQLVKGDREHRYIVAFYLSVFISLFTVFLGYFITGLSTLI